MNNPRAPGFLQLVFCALAICAPNDGVSANLPTSNDEPEQQKPTNQQPFRLHDRFQAPDWLLFSGSHRTRYEGLQNQFRPQLDKHDEALALRTLVTLGVTRGPLSLVGELQDSRAYLTDEDSGISTIVVNALAPLQAYVNLRLDDVFAAGDVFNVRAGLQTMDLGSRRLIARNRFRNTIQNYTGLSADWRARNGMNLFTFAVLPVRVEPNNADRDALLDNQIEGDRANFELKLWGTFLSQPVAHDLTYEGYFFALNESDDGNTLSRRRQLYTPGARLFRAAQPGKWDIDLESVLQFGRRRSSTDPANGGDDKVLAHFHHASVGYTFHQPWSPRLSGEFDYASGDDPATPQRHERFDSLFGPRRAEFGPTDIYGPLGRENIISAGARLGLRPNRRLDGFMSWRANWLAERQDVFARTGLRAPDGQSGSFAGHQIEFRTHLWLIPGSLRWELGGALFLRGRFMRNAPNSAGNGDPVFIYTGLDLSF